MSCSNPFCTCCQRAYLEGLQDGYGVGYRRGYKAGYITGYVEAKLEIPPPPSYTPAIQTKLHEYRLTAPEPVKNVLTVPMRRNKICRCAGICWCKWE